MLEKTSELTGRALDWAVAQCERFVEDVFEPSEHWGDGGPIIERRRLVCVAVTAHGAYRKVNGKPRIPNVCM
jgi:hypothetical protein